MLLGILAASLLGNMLADKGVVRGGNEDIRSSEGTIVKRLGWGTNRAGQSY